MRKILLTLTLISVFFVAQSQQLHFMSQFLQHNTMYNPAAAGMSNVNKLGFAYRSMWASFPGNPKTMMQIPKIKIADNNLIPAFLFKEI